MNLKRRFKLCVIIGGWIFIPALALALFTATANAQAETVAATDTPVSPDQFQASMQSALSGHRAELSELRVRLAGLEQLSATLGEQIRVYDSEMAARQQMLLMSQIAIEDIERAVRKNYTAQHQLRRHIETLQSQYDSASMLFIRAGDHIQLLSEQMSSLLRAKVPAQQELELEATANELIRVLNEKREAGDLYLKTYEAALNRLRSTLDKNIALGETMAARMESERDRWFYTPSNTYRQIFGKAFPESLAAFQKRIKGTFNPATWNDRWEQIKLGGVQRWAVFIFWVSLVIWFHFHFKARFERFEKRHDDPRWYYRCLGIFLLRRSMLYLGMTLVLGIYNDMTLPLLDIGLSRLLFVMFLMLLVTRWGLDYFQVRPKDSPPALHSFVSSNLKGLLRLLRAMVIGLTLFNWMAGRDSLLTFVAREMLIAIVFVWTVIFWRRLWRFVTEAVREGAGAPDPRWLGLLRVWSYVVSGGGLLISLAGYSIMAGFWIGSWIKTVSTLFWGWVSLNAIREWQRAYRDSQAAGDDIRFQTGPRGLGWAGLQLTLAAWLLAMARSMVWAWDNGNLMSKITSSFASTFTVGSLNFSIRGTVLAAVVLFITYLAVNVGRTMINKKVIADNTLEPGLKESISSILSYCAWGLGLLVALATLGVNATSLAVVFGALSVGIGFGLQNIFNNFVSGLILLFERPIQVGDTVEVNGVWAEVKKINVRATVVQTYDNASVIIPNSEFVSQQVTNWSFKDKRMRRNLEIGVAYGSDIDLVERTLLEIADNYRNVLKYPKPDVLFLDHGDSALIFRLRIWVHVDDYWTVPSKMRFEIDRKFREKNIEIAFPQRDIHIRDIPPGTLNRVSATGDLPGRQTGEGAGE